MFCLKRDKDYSVPSEYINGSRTWGDKEYDDVMNSLKPVIAKEGRKTIDWKTENG